MGFPSTTTAYEEEYTKITSSPKFDEMPKIQCEVESHLHPLSEKSDSTQHEIERIYFETERETPQNLSEVVDRASEDASRSNNLTSTTCVFS